MGINRDSRHKRRLTGGRMPVHQKKRAFEKGRAPANTKLHLTSRRVNAVRTRGGHFKFRALRLNEGHFHWPSEYVAKKSKILNVVYNASDHELVKTNMLVKNCIIQIDSTPFKQWYQTHYGIDLTFKKAGKKGDAAEEKHAKLSKSVIEKHTKRQKERYICPKLEEQFQVGRRLLACVSSRPGQSGRCDGYILEGKELEFYIKKIEAKGK